MRRRLLYRTNGLLDYYLHLGVFVQELFFIVAERFFFVFSSTHVGYYAILPQLQLECRSRRLPPPKDALVHSFTLKCGKAAAVFAPFLAGARGATLSLKFENVVPRS